MNQFFKDLSGHELVRKDSMFFTLGDEKLDNLYDLNQTMAVLTPNDADIMAFASASYLFGILGYTATNFTSVPTGFLVTYKNGEDSLTVAISDSYQYYREHLFDLAQNIVQTDLLLDQDKRIYTTIMDAVNDKDSNLAQVCLDINALLQNSPNKQYYQNLNQKAVYPFSGNKDSVNSQNCENNHILLLKLCCSMCDLDYDKYINKDYDVTDKGLVKQYDQSFLRAQSIQKDLLDKFIIPGYLSYRGADRQGNPLKQKPQILNSTKRVNILKQILDESKDDSVNIMLYRRMCVVLNACSTDYTADIVYDLLQQINQNNSKDAQSEELFGRIPKTPYNNADKDNTKEFISKLYGSINYGIGIDKNLEP